MLSDMQRLVEKAGSHQVKVTKTQVCETILPLVTIKRHASKHVIYYYYICDIFNYVKLSVRVRYVYLSNICLRFDIELASTYLRFLSSTAMSIIIIMRITD